MPEGSSEIDISLVVPVHNEEEILKTTIDEIVTGMEARHHNFELILVENGSTDKSASIIEELVSSDPRIIGRNLPKPSYGAALEHGLRNANGNIIAHFSTDIVDLEFLDTAVEKLKTVDLVIGSKLIAENQDRRSLGKRVGSIAFHLFIRLIIHMPVADSHGIKAMKSGFVGAVLEKCKGGSEIFDDEFVLRAVREGVSFTEISFIAEEIRPSRTGILARAIKALGQVALLRIILWKERLTRS